MALTLNSQPDQYTPIDKLSWRITLSDGGIDPIVKRLGYQLFDGAGSPLTGQRSVSYSPNGAYIHFGDLISGFLKTPFSGVGGTISAPDFTKDVYLEYKEIHYNKDTGQTSEVGTAQTPTVTVLNSISQYFDQDPFLNYPAEGVILSRRPSSYQVFRDQIDYLYLITGSTSAAMTLTAHYPDGRDVTEPSVTIPANTAQGQALTGPFMAISPADQSFSRLQYVFTGGISAEYNIYIKEPCKESFDLFFLESLGGWSSFRFEEQAPGIARKLFRYRSPTAGLSSGGSDNFETYDLRGRRVIRSAADQTFLREMFSAQVHYLRVQTSSGSTYQKFILDDGNFKVDQTTGLLEVRLTGRLAKNYETLTQL